MGVEVWAIVGFYGLEQCFGWDNGTPMPIVNILK